MQTHSGCKREILPDVQAHTHTHYKFHSYSKLSLSLSLDDQQFSFNELKPFTIVKLI